MPLCDAAPTIVDPTGAELAALAEIVDFSGLRVFEIGCGGGRLTWRYAGPTEEVVGIDQAALWAVRQGVVEDGTE